MFESVVIRRVKPKKVEWISPKYIKLVEDETIQDGSDIYSIAKGAENYLSKVLGMKPSTSKDVYKISDKIWKDLKNVVLSKAADDMSNPFNLVDDSTLYFVNENRELIDIVNVSYEDTIAQIDTLLEEYKLDITSFEKVRKFYTDGKDGIVKLVCYNKDVDLSENEYTPVVILEFNPTKSTYKVYTAILLYKSFTFIPHPDIVLDDDKFSRFLTSFNLMGCLELAEDRAKELYEIYQIMKERDTEISARELLNLLNSVGYKLSLKDDAQIGEIKNLNDETANMEIQNFFNTFDMVTNESAMDILSLSDLQKIFRYNKLTFTEVLKILSKEYLAYEGEKITVEKLSDIVISVYNKKVDKVQTEWIKKEII